MPKFQVKKVTAQMNIMYYQTTEQKKICIKKKYKQNIKNEVVRLIKTFDTQQLACKTILDNFAINTQSNNYSSKLKLPLKWLLKLIKQGARIISVNILQQKIKSEYKLNIFYLAIQADDLLTLFINAIKTNPIKLLV